MSLAGHKHDYYRPNQKSHEQVLNPLQLDSKGKGPQQENTVTRLLAITNLFKFLQQPTMYITLQKVTNHSVPVSFLR